jgi:hypothetical protein
MKGVVTHDRTAGALTGYGANDPTCRGRTDANPIAVPVSAVSTE